MIDTAINKFLLTYPNILNTNIAIEELEDGTKKLALQRTGVEIIKQYYINGKTEEYQYMLFLRNYSEDNNQRADNLEWLDDLANWLYTQTIQKNFPDMGNKICTNMRSANQITYQIEEDGVNSVYAIQLYFTIKS